jgi:hypothetical protein
MNSSIETVPCIVVRETAAAYFLRDQDEPTREAYFPKSQVSFSRRNINTGEAVAEIPLWLLDSKGWNT